MARNHVFRSILLAAGALFLAACATKQPEGTLLEKRFQQTAKHYQQYQYEGQIIYCKRGATRSLPPAECITEAGLRKRVEDYLTNRNPVQRGGPPYVATVPGGSGT
jgi:hypothetical protein